MTNEQTPTSSGEPSGAGDHPPDDLRAGYGLGYSLEGAIAMALQQHLKTPLSDALAISVSVVEMLGEADSFRDERGQVWTKVPAFDGDGQALPFDARNAATLREAAARVLTFSPEAAAVFAGIAYPSAFREAKIERVVWLGRTGEVVSPPDVFNSLDSALMLTEAMYVRLQQIRLHEQKQLGELLARKKEAYEQRQQPQSATGEAGATQGP